MDLLYFVVLIGSLIFVHELGHFLFAKAFGVKVITFCLGFGPKILKLRGRETEYCIALIPLGGYVRMLESSKTDVVMPEMDAFELVDRMISRLPGLRILYTSGYTDATAEGPFIHKPFTPAQLVAKVGAVLTT